MIKIEHDPSAPENRRVSLALKDVRFDNARLAALGVELMSVAELREKVPARQLGQPERVDFFMLMLVTAGNGRHCVDFVDCPLQPGSLVFVRPGQVQQWYPADAFAAQLLLFAPTTLPHQGAAATRERAVLAFDEWPTQLLLQAPTSRLIASGLKQLRADIAEFVDSELDVALIRHALMSLLLRVAKLAAQASPRAPGHHVYRLFVRALEADFTRQHSVQFYATRLGYSTSTLSRACLAAAGRSAKALIDQRIALEAQRLLVHSAASVAAIAHQLGFSEATNFIKFFRRQVGSSPAQLRRSGRAGAGG